LFISSFEIKSPKIKSRCPVFFYLFTFLEAESDVGIVRTSSKALRKSLDPRSTAKTVVKYVFFLNQNTKEKKKKKVLMNSLYSNQLKKKN